MKTQLISNNYKRILLIAALSMLILAVFIAAVSCSDNNKKKVETINVGGNMPSLKAESIGLGDLYEMDLNNLAEQNKENNNGLEAVYLCSTQDQNELFAINKYQLPVKSSLQDVTKNYASKCGISEYRIGNSETYLLEGKKIEDGYFVRYDMQETGNYVVQTCVFLDNTDAYIFDFVYKCKDDKLEGTNLCVDVPTKYHVSENEYFYTDLKYKCLYYDEIKELPSVMYSVIDKENRTIDQYASKMASDFKNCTKSEVVVNNLPATKLTVKQHQKEGSTEVYNANIYLFDTKNKIVSVVIAELDGAKTYALDAFEHCIHSVNN